MQSKHLKAACLGAALATAWSAPEAAKGDSNVELGYVFNGSVVVTTITHAVLGYSYTGPAQARSGPYSLDDSSPINFTLPNEPEDFDKFVIIGLASPGHVVVSMSSGSDAFDTPFETVFPGYDESTIAGYLDTDNSAVDTFLYDVLDGPYATSFGVAADAVLFSDGQFLGSLVASADAVPEPSGLMLGAIIGGAGMLTRRRR